MFVLDKAVEAAPPDQPRAWPVRYGGEPVGPMLATRRCHRGSARSLTPWTRPGAADAGADRNGGAGQRRRYGPLFGLPDLGVKISIDDYGTGLSTLDYLKKVPASEIKIDQSFVKSMRDHRSDLVMVQSTIALAHSLGRTVVAEGVESREILDMLVAMKCEVAQGLHHRPRRSSLNDLSKRLTSDGKRRAA